MKQGEIVKNARRQGIEIIAIEMQYLEIWETVKNAGRQRNDVIAPKIQFFKTG